MPSSSLRRLSELLLSEGPYVTTSGPQGQTQIPEMSEGCHGRLMAWSCVLVSLRSGFDPEIDTLGITYISASAHSREERKQVFSWDRGRSNVPAGLCALPVTPATVRAVYDCHSLPSRTLCPARRLHTDSLLCTSYRSCVGQGRSYQPWVRKEKVKAQGVKWLKEVTEAERGERDSPASVGGTITSVGLHACVLLGNQDTNRLCLPGHQRFQSQCLCLALEIVFPPVPPSQDPGEPRREAPEKKREPQRTSSSPACRHLCSELEKISGTISARVLAGNRWRSQTG